jgi:hypothetical protein
LGTLPAGLEEHHSEVSEGVDPKPWSR